MLNTVQLCKSWLCTDIVFSGVHSHSMHIRNKFTYNFIYNLPIRHNLHLNPDNIKTVHSLLGVFICWLNV